ncbi:hypothetical protein [Acaryochloris sp. IP29b_bin.148]|uniref:hypothetical protein n=1 Tax=Acaryochloris sp. IP29b_bin.148 TaxID=2969218 RepID=UPI00260C4040|nr:hypothetical protein [Acaryochloris sp. IP29b_bin.148]
MVDSLTISNAPLEHPGMDYAFLRQEGIKSIQQLAGSRWTDYNSHDPGITILEALCYAITDLSYRLSFAIEDLLAQPVGTSNAEPLFLTAREILTVNPLTITDYRKLLIDIDGVKNAWLEPIKNPQPELYYDAPNARLSFSSENLAEPVRLQGLYRVLIEPELAYQGREQALAAFANARLQQHRNLCEDFAEITVLGFEEIIVNAAIEIAEAVDPQVLMGQIHTALTDYISPSLPFLSLPTLLEQGKPVEDIFAGPILDHGFLDDAQLQQFERKTELHTSDLIRIILDLPGVNAVKHITLTGSQAKDQEWALDLNSQLTPRLHSLEPTVQAGNIKFYKGQILCELDFAQVQQTLSVLAPSQPQSSTSQRPPASSLDLPIPTGDYRELSDYVSVQSEFPVTYGIGEIGLPASASPERKAQAKQLQAYLMVFDQLLANYFAQLDHARDLFSLSNTQIQTYFSQSIAHFPGGNEILQATYKDYLNDSSAETAVDLDRKNRLLDHLIAQYGETFTNHSLLYPNTFLSDTLLKRKADFARDYRQISAGRGQAFNYTRNPNDLKTVSNVSGLKRRVARLLGMDPDRQFLASDDNKEGFYIVEHILLRPRRGLSSGASSNTNPNAPTSNFLSFSQSITEFKASVFPDHLTCTSPNHGLKAGGSINIFYSTHYSGTYRVLDNPKVDTFDIKKPFVAEDTGEWVRSNQCPDPFSFQLSVIIPSWPGRFRLPSVKQLIYDTLIAETPAHITLHIHWLDQAKMRDFESIYALWLQHLSGNVKEDTGAEAEASVTRLINFLELGSTEIPVFPALLGYMTISQGEADASTENPFTVSPNRSGPSAT